MADTYSAQERELLTSLGDRIRFLRKQQSFSQEELAHRAGLDRTYIGSVERGERNIAVINLQKIAQALEVSLAELVSFER